MDRQRGAIRPDAGTTGTVQGRARGTAFHAPRTLQISHIVAPQPCQYACSREQRSHQLQSRGPHSFCRTPCLGRPHFAQSTCWQNSSGLLLYRYEAAASGASVYPSTEEIDAEENFLVVNKTSLSLLSLAVALSRTPSLFFSISIALSLLSLPRSLSPPVPSPRSGEVIGADLVPNHHALQLCTYRPTFIRCLSINHAPPLPQPCELIHSLSHSLALSLSRALFL